MKIITRRQSLASLLSALSVTSARALNTSEPLPHFVARTLDGERVTNESVKGKVLLIEFWATWCPPCKSDEPVVERLLAEFENQGFMVLAVNMGEPRRKVKKYLETAERSSKIVLAEDTTLAAICDAKVYPLYALVGRDGKVVGVQRGAGGEAPLRRLLSKAGLES